MDKKEIIKKHIEKQVLRGHSKSSVLKEIVSKFDVTLATAYLYTHNFKFKKKVLIMSHPVNDEILENLYEEVKEEFPNALEPFVIAEVQKRFEEMST